MFNNATKESRIAEDAFSAYLVNGAHFTRQEEYPIIPAEMISTIIPQNVMPFNKALNFRGDLNNTFICSYSPDETFERLRRNPKRYLHFFRRTAGIIGFDYSIHSDMPVVKQKNQIYDNLSLTYYYGNNGIPIIPNVRCGIEDLLPEFMEAIPKHKTVAIGTHGFCKELWEKCEWYCFIEKMLNALQPSQIVVYGSLNGKMFDDFKNRADFIFFEPWISNKRKGDKKDGN